MAKVSQYVFESKTLAQASLPKDDSRFRIYEVTTHENKVMYVIERFSVTALGRVFEHLGFEAKLATTNAKVSKHDLMTYIAGLSEEEKIALLS